MIKILKLKDLNISEKDLALIRSCLFLYNNEDLSGSDPDIIRSRLDDVRQLGIKAGFLSDFIKEKQIIADLASPQGVTKEIKANLEINNDDIQSPKSFYVRRPQDFPITDDSLDELPRRYFQR